jgi:hypothetical protein
LTFQLNKTNVTLIGFIMDKNIIFKIVVLLSLLSLLACGSGSGGSSDGGATKNPPELEDVDPAANDSSVLLGAAILAFFDEDMRSASDTTFAVYGSQTGKLAGTYTGGGSDTLRFDPDNGFKIGEEIEVILTDSLTSTQGESLEAPVVYRFRAEAVAGTGDFEIADTVAGQTNAQGLAAGDWDGDDDVDLAVANNGASRIDILVNDGLGDFSIGDTIPGQTNARALAAGDWDGDGDPDLAVANSGGASRVDILVNNGSGDFTAVDTIAGQTNAQDLTAGDWDGDGDLDLAVANFGASRVDILKNDGTGDFTPTDTIAGQTNAQALAAGDWDDDGDLDLAVANSSASRVDILINAIGMMMVIWIWRRPTMGPAGWISWKMTARATSRLQI